jgi:uncharacterized protein
VNEQVHIQAKGLQYCVGHCGVNITQASKVLELIVTQGSTVPFVARYRKEVTGNLDEVKIRAVVDSYNEFVEIENRRDYIIKAIKKLKALTPELETTLLKARTLEELENLYAPYKAKKKTLATLAREAGLEPLAKEILITPKNSEALKAAFSPTETVKTWEEAFMGAQHIITEMMTHKAEIREALRDLYWQKAALHSEVKKDAAKIKDHLKFKDFFDHTEPVWALNEGKSSHRFLAMMRGAEQKILKVELLFPIEEAIHFYKKNFYENEFSLGCLHVIKACAEKSWTVYVHPSLELEINAELKKTADEAAINVFSVNLKNLLLSPYLGAKMAMGIDPGIRTGCKVAIVDQTGKLVLDFVISPHTDKETSALLIQRCLDHLKIDHIAIGNGTFGRETLEFLEQTVESVKNGKAKATLVSEAGASIYSASEIAREEFPDKDITVRGAVSIARRFQDPLAELVKIEPKSIGVGQYQHDVNQTKLSKSLTEVVESCVNYVGVDVNTASAPLLAYISGIGPALAKNIVDYRQAKGVFYNRGDLMHIPRFSEKVFEQAAGFLRIYNGSNPLDATFIHPERYKIIQKWADRHDMALAHLIKDKALINQMSSDSKLAQEIGEFTFKDMMKSLSAPTQDPRSEFKSIEFDKNLRSITDVKVGQWYNGVVNNITAFGAFVDIGLKESGLVHVSEMADKFVSNALDVFKIGQEVKVRVLEVDLERHRLSLSCKTDHPPVQYQPREQDKHHERRDRPFQPHDRPGQRQQPRQDEKLTNKPFEILKNLKIK